MLRDIAGRANGRLRRTGYAIARTPAKRLVQVMRSRGITLVLDVGANRGQFASELRVLGYEGRIISYEPLAEPFQALERAAEGDPGWAALNTAVGDANGRRAMNVASNGAASSSFLEMLDAHRAGAPEVSYVASQDVDVRTLDALATPVILPDDVAMLKVDVQGYEQQVLAGGKATLARASLVSLEVSFVALYAKSLVFADVLDFMQKAGFVLADIEPIFRTRDQQVLAADATFLRVNQPGVFA
jgi:FkbM family methyltransferase